MAEAGLTPNNSNTSLNLATFSADHGVDDFAAHIDLQYLFPAEFKVATPKTP